MDDLLTIDCENASRLSCLPFISKLYLSFPSPIQSPASSFQQTMVQSWGVLPLEFLNYDAGCTEELSVSWFGLISH